MEPPVKRRRLGENPQSRDDEGPDEEEWEEYDGDEDIEDVGPDQREGSVEQDDGYQLAIEKAYADNRFRATMARIYEKYGRDFEGIGDEIDLSTGEIVVNNGHIQNMRNEVDVGDGSVTYDQNENELEVFTENETGEYNSHELEPDDVMDDDDSNQSWTSDADDTEVTLNKMQLQRSGPLGPTAVDGMLEHDQVADGSPNMISRLYNGGGLRYASSLGEFGASPFALGPWDTLPQAQDRYELPKQDGLGSIWAPDYRFKENEPSQRTPIRARLGLSRARPRPKRPKALPPTKTQNGGNRDTIGSKNRLGNAPEAHYSSLVERERAKRMGKMPSWVDDMDESDTDDDAVFSEGELTMSSETGDATDEVSRSKALSTAEPSNRVIPDSQESYVSQGTIMEKPTANPPLQSNQAKPKDFDSACLLSDDESPIFSQPFGPTTTINLTKTAKAPEKAISAISPVVNPDGTTVKRGRGRPRKWPPGYRPPRGPRKKPKPNLPTLPELPQPFAIPTPNPIRTETVPGVKRKRGRPRKYPPRETMSQQSPMGQNFQHPNVQHPFPGSMNQPFLPTFQPGMQQSPFQYPFQALFQQPVYQLPQQMAYQQLQQSYIQQHMYQLQQQMVQQPIQQLMQQPMLSPLYQTQPQMPAQPVKRKRGRPRKHPIRFDSVYPGYVMNRKRTTPKKLYDGIAGHEQLPGLRNSMTALVNGQPGRIMVSEDAWYGVARQLAQDIACLQGGALFAGQFRDGTQTSSKKRPRSSSKDTDQPMHSPPSPPPPQDADDRPVRITELSEVSDAEITQHEHISRDNHIYPAPVNPVLADEALVEAGMINSVVDEAAAGEPGLVDPKPIEPYIADPAFSNRGLTGLAFVDSSSSDSDIFDLTLIDPALNDKAAMEPSPTEPAAATSVLIDEDVFDPALVDPALLAEVPDSPMDDDDAGFIPMDSPKSVTKNVEPTPSPPSPPPSMQRSSSPLKAAERRTPTPAPGLFATSHTPTSLEHIKSPTPTSSHKSDEYDLPSSPEPNIRVPTPAAPTLPSEDVTMEPDDSVVEEQKSALEAKEIVSLPLDSVKSVPKLVEPFQPPDEKVEQHRDPAEEQTESTGMPRDNQATPTPKASADRSPTVTRPQTPEPRKSAGPEKRTRKKSPERRRSMVPRSAERCTPIFMEPSLFVKSPPRSPARKPPTIQRRTMGELKQAVIEPWQKPQEPKVAAPKPKSKAVELEPVRPSMSTKPRTPLPHVNRHRSSAPSKTENFFTLKPSVSRPSTSKLSTSKPATSKSSTSGLSTAKLAASKPSTSTLSTSKSSTSKASASRPSTSKSTTPQFSFSNVAKKPSSRRSLLSLAAGEGNSMDLDDEDDELGSPVKSKPSSLTKSSKPPLSNDFAPDKTWKSSSRITETHHKLPREKEKGKDRGTEKKKKKKRRHTDGSTAKECGVDGYTCNKDFCFTCL